MKMYVYSSFVTNYLHTFSYVKELTYMNRSLKGHIYIPTCKTDIPTLCALLQYLGNERLIENQDEFCFTLT